MSGPLLYDFGGLVTAPGLLARNPASCVIAENWRYPMPGIMRKRTGFDLGAQTAGANEVFVSLMSSPAMADRFLAQGGGAAASTLYYGGPNVAWAALTDTGATSPTYSRHARMAVLGGSHYVCAQSVRRIASTFTSHRAAGMPRGLSPFVYSMDPAVYSVLTGTSTWLPNGANVAYRVTYHVKNGDVELGGPPTSRLVIRNISGTSGFTGATRDVTLRIPVPYEIDSSTTLVTTSFYWRLWRSRTATGADTADDEMYLVAEAFFTAGDIAAGYAVFNDITPDAFLLTSPRLNTNSLNFAPIEAGLENGITNADEPPPAICQDMAPFADCMFYAQPAPRVSLLLTLISPAFTAGDTITINGTVLTAVAGFPGFPNEFTIVTGLATLSLNIEATARNIVDTWNRNAARANMTASYISQGTQSPGQIQFEGTAALGAFTIQSAAAGQRFSPNIVASKTIVATSSTNELWFSKPGRPDAVPTVNVISVGPSSAVIYRIVPFRERLLCFTTEGLYQVDGTYYGNFTVALVDASARIFQQECVVVQDDKCFAWCFNGILQIDDGGTSYVSTPIEPTIRTIMNQTYAFGSGTIYGSAFAVAGKADHVVYFFYTSDGTINVNCTKWLEYDVRSQKWSTGATTDGTGRGCGAIQQSSGLLVLGLSGDRFAPSGVAKCFIARSAYDGTTDYTDDTPAGTAEPIVATATFQFQLPDPDSRAHWQQVLLQFENGEQSYYPRPTSVDMQWETDPAGTSGYTTYPVASPLLRVETPASYRRSTRSRVTVRHVLAEHAGVLVLNQSVTAEGARFPK